MARFLPRSEPSWWWLSLPTRCWCWLPSGCWCCLPSSWWCSLPSRWCHSLLDFFLGVFSFVCTWSCLAWLSSLVWLLHALMAVSCLRFQTLLVDSFWLLYNVRSGVTSWIGVWLSANRIIRIIRILNIKNRAQEGFARLQNKHKSKSQ